MIDEALRLARQRRLEAERDFLEELRIPSISALSEHRPAVRRNAEWLAERLERIGFATAVTDVAGGTHPVLRADLIVDPRLRTLTIYGHYDVQPIDPLDEWKTPPFEPDVRDGMVYARGA